MNARLVIRKANEEGMIINVGDVEIGGKKIVIIAGPCSVESEEQICEIARAVRRMGADMLRGGAFKPRTSPYSFQGLGEEGLRLLALAREETGLPVVTEVMDTKDVKLVSRYADVLQVGARNMQNFALLKALGKVNKPVLLKRGLWATIEEWLLAAEYIALGGNREIILCERGIRTFEKLTRNTFDVMAIPLVKTMSCLPIIADPSHATGRRDLVIPAAKAAIAAGADGIMVEVHVDPERALSDGAQSLSLTEFKPLMEELRKIAEAVGRCI
ncbi:MAG: 3-deoxy-7-phosphoheptulonate synthase [Thermoprotei archaeon]|nr:3-deoxy-7-phosphoheptulonate synthase [Thermoprotei archaeon]